MNLTKKNQRLRCLDAFRGMTIAGMIIVNQAGIPGKTYSFLEHSDWHGLQGADLIFPFFLFIVGVAIAFSLGKYNQINRPTSKVYSRILRRSLILFALGLGLNGFWHYDFSNIRLMGVLQRISLSYLFTCLIVLNLSRKAQWLLGIFLLVGYWLAMMYIPVPEFGAGNLTRDGNFAAYFDRLLISPNHLYPGDNFNSRGDPEGLFSTLPATVTVLIGYWTGIRLKLKSKVKDKSARITVDLIIFGISCLIIGNIWSIWFPINKKLWTSSYVLVTSGIALFLLAIFYYVIEVKNIKSWAKPFEILGLNPIVIFVAAILGLKTLLKVSINNQGDSTSIFILIYDTIFARWAGELNGSLLFAMATLLFWWGVAYLLYKKSCFVRI